MKIDVQITCAGATFFISRNGLFSYTVVISQKTSCFGNGKIASKNIYLQYLQYKLSSKIQRPGCQSPPLPHQNSLKRYSAAKPFFYYKIAMLLMKGI